MVEELNKLKRSFFKIENINDEIKVSTLRNEEKIISSLAVIQTEQQNNLSPICIDVAQGCYAKINEFTPSNVKGLLTTGLNVCTCIIVTDPEHKNIVLAHADGNHTNLLDPDHGLKSWIDQIPGENVEIHVGKKELYELKNSQNILNNEKSAYYNNVYQDQINEIIELYEGSSKKIILKNTYIDKRIEEEDICHVGYACGITTGALIERNTIIKNPIFGKTDGELLDSIINSKDIIDDIRTNFPNTTGVMAKDFLQNEGYNLEQYNELKRDFNIEENLKQQNLLFQLTYKIYGQEEPKITDNMPLPPICCYNGVGQPKKESQNIQRELNSKYGLIIDQYAEQIKSILEQNPEFDNKKVLENFKQQNVKELERELDKKMYKDLQKIKNQRSKSCRFQLN